LTFADEIYSSGESASLAALCSMRRCRSRRRRSRSNSLNRIMFLKLRNIWNIVVVVVFSPWRQFYRLNVVAALSLWKVFYNIEAELNMNRFGWKLLFLFIYFFALCVLKLLWIIMPCFLSRNFGIHKDSQNVCSLACLGQRRCKSRKRMVSEKPNWERFTILQLKNKILLNIELFYIGIRCKRKVHMLLAYWILIINW